MEVPHLIAKKITLALPTQPNRKPLLVGKPKDLTRSQQHTGYASTMSPACFWIKIETSRPKQTYSIAPTDLADPLQKAMSDCFNFIISMNLVQIS
jgi:hypothetical protein